MRQADFNKLFVESICSGETNSDLTSFIKLNSKISATRALEVYREDYEVRMREALKNTYRAIYEVLGDEDFNLMAQDYLKKYPSQFTDLDDYGHDLENFLSGYSNLFEYPFLNELANLEWNYRFIFHSFDYTGLTAQELEHCLLNDSIKLKMIPSAVCLSYNYSIHSIYTYHEDAPTFDLHQSEHLLMFKKKTSVKIHLLSENQCEILKSFHSPKSFSECLQNAPAKMTPVEMQELFSLLGEQQLLMKFS